MVSKQMRNSVTDSIIAFATSVVALVATNSIAGTAGAAHLLSGNELRQDIPGATINLDTPLGSVVPVTYGADGSLEGSA
ncbi:MAG: hypothetical protein ACRETL_11175, partial [Gammaproteobacteria bacterium]